MPCNHIWDKVCQSPGHYDRVQENSWLCDLGLFQVIGGPTEHYVCDPESEYVIGIFEHLPCDSIAVIKVFRHSRVLRSLSGEYIRFHVL